MVDVYVALIINGFRTIDDVPEESRDAVANILDALKMSDEGKPLNK